MRTLLVTRPEAQARAFGAALAKLLPGRFRVVVAPLIAIAPVAGALDLRGVQGLVFTSANGVAQFAARSDERAVPAYCVGAMTAAAARRAGFAVRSADGDVEALAALVIGAARAGAGDFLHVRGRHAAGDLTGRLAAAGVPARAAEIYDQVPVALPDEARDLLARRAVEVVALFSPRTAGRFAAEAAEWDLGGVTAVSLSAATDAALGLAVGRRVVAAAPTRDGHDRGAGGAITGLRVVVP